MDLTGIEREMTRVVRQFFMSQHEAISHGELLRKFNDPRVILTLKSLRILNTVGAGSQHSYLPTILAFHYSGDDSLKERAKNAVEAAIARLKTLFQESYDSNRQYPAEAMVSGLQTANAPVPNAIALGLYLTKELPNVFLGVEQNEEATKVTSFRINEHILTLVPKEVWDQHVRRRTFTEDAVRAQIAARQRPTRIESKNPSSWLPERWKIEGPLGEGGQGWTYKVRRSEGPDRGLYVLKRLKNKKRLSRFQNEIAALTKLQHTGILKIIETSEESETPFFVAEYCEGPDLGTVNLSNKSLVAKLQIFRSVCDAVAAAHNAGILHRDLKPPNILTRKDDSVVVGDFGLCIDLNETRERATKTLEGVGAERYIARSRRAVCQNLSPRVICIHWGRSCISYSAGERS